jgi:hypothetical protein
MRVVGLYHGSTYFHAQAGLTVRTYVEASLQFAIAAQLYDDNFVNAQAHEVEWLVGLFFFVHCESDCGYVRWLVGRAVSVLAE